MTVLEEESPEQEVVMPGYIVHKRDLKTFMRWFNAANPAGLDRANAKLPAEMRSMSLLTFAILMPSHNIDLMRYLLLRGSNVNKKSDSGRFRSKSFLHLLLVLRALKHHYPILQYK